MVDGWHACAVGVVHALRGMNLAEWYLNFPTCSLKYLSVSKPVQGPGHVAIGAGAQLPLVLLLVPNV